MERKPNNNFSSFLIIEQYKASFPASLSDKGKYIIPISDKEFRFIKMEQILLHYLHFFHHYFLKKMKIMEQYLLHLYKYYIINF